MCVVTALVLSTASAFAQSSSPMGGGASLLGSPLVVAGSPFEGEQAHAQKLAALANPETVAEREASRTRYESLSAEQAERVDGEAFPEVFDEPAGGPPKLPAGESIAGYPAADAAQVDLPEGGHGVVASMLPMAVEVSPGRRVPLDLGLSEAGAAFAPRTPLVGVSIPRSLGSGVSLGVGGVSLTPVDSQGAALGGSEGKLDGAAVLYANAATDTDVAVKPTTLGFEADAVLRSVESPRQLFFRVGMPEGASLVQASGGSGALNVVSEGATVATVLPVSAQDAAGIEVPVSMSVSGDLLTLTVEAQSGSYQWPVEVDPTVTDSQMLEAQEPWAHSNWAAETSRGYPDPFCPYEEASAKELIDSYSRCATKEYKTGEWGAFGYETQGESHIYGFITETSGGGGTVENNLLIASKEKGVEAITHLPASYSSKRTEVCVAIGCSPGEVTKSNQGNQAQYQQMATGSGNTLNSVMSSASVEIVQSATPTVSFDTTDATLSGEKNILYGSSNWLGANSGTGLWQATASDPGIGISEIAVTSPESPGKELKESYLWPSYKALEDCRGVQCKASETFGPWCCEPRWLPNGEDTLEVKAKNATGGSATARTKIKVDWEPPYNITLTGIPPNHEIGSEQYHFKVSATDGSGTTVSSGVVSITLAIDGKELSKQPGSCSPGPCTAGAEWTLSGTEFGAGTHSVSMTATDGAGNVGYASTTMYVGRPTSPVAVGPGSVDPESGELSLAATDVSVAAPGGALTVGRSYGSLHVGEPTESPLGPGWLLELGAAQTLVKLPNGSVLLTTGSGLQSIFTSRGSGEFTPPKGDENMVLTEVEKEKAKEFLLKVAGSTTKFVLPSGGTGSTWVPERTEGPGSIGAVTYAYQTTKEGVTEPTEELAPVVAGVSCSSKLEKGCRALTFSYATGTTATGEASNEWGEYTGRLVGVSFTGWDPSKKEMTTTAVAKYEYDHQGRLRAEWDPRVSPALKTTYGYDSEGHVTALTPPGQQPWLMTYGARTADTRTGHLLAVTRPAASTAAGNGKAPVNTTAPALSTTSPVEDTTLSVSTGAWSNSPLSYAYQWEECEEGEKGAEICRPILGADNQTYTPGFHRGEYWLAVLVTATDSDGSATVWSNKSGHVASKGFFEEKATFGTSGSGKLSKPTAVAVDPSGNVWVADTGDDRIVKFSASGEYLAAYGKEGTGNEQFKEPQGIVIDKSGYVYVADAGNSRIEVLDSSGKYVTQKATSAAPGGIAIGLTKFESSSPAEEVLYVTIPSKDEVAVFEIVRKSGLELSAGAPFGKEGTGEGQFKDPTAVTAGDRVYSRGNYVYVADTGNNRVEVFEPLGFFGLVKYYSQFGKEGKGEGQFSSPGGLAFEPEGLTGEYDRNIGSDLYVTDTGNSRIQQFTGAGAYLNQYATGSGAHGVAFNTSKSGVEGAMYLTSGTASSVQELVPGPPPIGPPEPPSPGTSAVTTIEYHVPVSGTAAPYAMGSKEVEAWAQKDDPTEATAIFPPDEPEGWPAQNYRRATVYYLDSSGRTVNVAHPGGGISTSEYSATGDVTRSLSPDNRAAALKEGSFSAVISKTLDTQSTYNEEGSELLSTLGPQHTVKLSSGSGTLARSHTIYHYDEGAPSEGGPYRLATKVTQGAQLTSGEEVDIRTTTTAYSGQEGLGWKLHKPTSVTTDPGGLNLVHVTEYNATSGEVTETKTPAASGKNATVAPTYASQFGSKGAGSGQFGVLPAVAIGPNEEVWISDKENNRIDEFSSSGKFTEAIGFGVSNGEAKYETCTTGCKAGIAGAGNGQFSNPTGVSVNRGNGNIYVVDGGNNRIEELSSGGAVLRSFGGAGTGIGQLNTPAQSAIDTSGDLWVVDYGNSRLEEFSAEGTPMLVAGWGVKDGKSEAETCTSSCQAGVSGSGAGQFFNPESVAIAEGNVYVVDRGNNRIEVFSATGSYKRQFGSKGTGNGQFSAPFGIALSSSNGNLYVSDKENNRIEVFTPADAFLTAFAATGSGNGQVSEPKGIAVNASGDIYVADSGNYRLEEWAPTITGNEEAHDTKTIYYTAKEEASVSTCRNHPEWAGLPCQAAPAAQPGTSGLPELPVKTITYNIWDEPETTTETAGSTTRTTTIAYDAAGRTKTSSTTSTIGTALPTVTDTYNTETGSLEKQSTTVEGKTKTITSVYNTLGELTSYTDADENTSTYKYDIDGRPEEVNDGKGIQGYVYDATSGLPTKLTDSAAGAFTAGYDVEGNMTTQGYPNGMTATYTLNKAGEATGLEYVKTTHCTSGCTWFSDTAIPSIHAQWLSQASTLAGESYAYDASGRLTQVQETPAGQGCTTRIYAYDEETNRTSLTTRAPGSEGKCASEGGTSESHTYDTADRLLDSGVAYDAFGDITALPASDAGGHELTSSYYVDGQTASQTQNGQTIGYQLDPAGRTRETVATGTSAANVTDHFVGPGSSPAWMQNTTTKTWTRYIRGFSGLAAIQANGGTPVLQLTDPQGNVVATAALSESETKLLTTERSTEYGTPTTSSPPKYSWLGGKQEPTEFASGMVAMGARSYVPQIGRFLQRDPVPGGSADAYAYTYGDPIGESDPSGALSWGFSSWAVELNNRMGQEVVAREAAREAAEQAAKEAAARAEAEHKAAAAEPSEPLGGYPGWAEEYALETGQGEEGGASRYSANGDFIQCKHPGCSQYCVEHAKVKEPNCGKGPYTPGPVEKCLFGAFGGWLVSWIPGVNVGAAELAIAGCAAATGDPSSKVTRKK
jgi:RHS repeat-associated protein